MNKKKITFLIYALSISAATYTQIHQTIAATGGNASGTGGSSISFTVGQIAYGLKGSSEWSVSEGVQQPYEISVLKTSIESTEDITLEYKVFPNPVHDFFKLTVKPFHNEKMRYRLYNDNGLKLLDKKVESEETLISVDNFISTIYYLKIFIDNKEVKIFKIVKI